VIAEARESAGGRYDEVALEHSADKHGGETIPYEEALHINPLPGIV